jgi:hypothetical protein
MTIVADTSIHTKPTKPSNVVAKQSVVATAVAGGGVSREILEKEDGNDHFKKGDYVAAIKCYTRCLGYNPRNAIVLSNRAMAHLKMKEFGKAEKDASLALQFEPQHVKSYARRASARNALGKHRLAILDMEVALEFEPTNKMMQLQLKATRDALKQAIKRAPKQTIPIQIQMQHRPASHSNGNAADDILAAARGNTPHEKPLDDKNNNNNNNTDSRYSQDRPPRKKEEPRQMTTRWKVKVPEKPPSTSYDFQRVWNTLKHGENVPSLRMTYLRRLDIPTLPSLFKDAIEPDLLHEIVQVLAAHVVPTHETLDNTHDHAPTRLRFVVDFLLGLTTVPRFQTVVRFLSDTEKAPLYHILSSAEGHVSNDDLCTLKERYGLRNV